MENKKKMEGNLNKDQSEKSKLWKVVKTVFLVLVWVCLVSIIHLLILIRQFEKWGEK